MQPEEPKGPTEVAALGVELAELGDDAAMKYAEVLRSFEPTEADAVTAHLLVHEGRLEDATSVLESLFVRLRTDPWPMESLISSELADAELLDNDLLAFRSMRPMPFRTGLIDAP